MSIGQRIRQARNRKGLAQAAVASHFGISRAAVTQWENGDTGPDREKLDELARLLDVTVGWLVGEAQQSQAELSYPPPPPGQAGVLREDPVPFDYGHARPGDELVGATDLPVYASAEGGAFGMTISYDPIEYVKRPEPLLKVQKAFGFYVVGDSMSPKFDPGDLLLVHGAKPVSRGDHVLVLLHDGKDDALDAMVKRFVGWDGDRLRLEQYNPPGEIAPIPRERVFNIHLVVGSYLAR